MKNENIQITPPYYYVKYLNIEGIFCRSKYTPLVWHSAIRVGCPYLFSRIKQ